MRSDNIIARLRTHGDKHELDPETEQLLRDAAVALIRVAPELRALGEDVSDSAFIPDQDTADAVVMTALNHAAATDAQYFFLRVPGTTPELVVALGDRFALLNALADHIGTV